MEVTVGGGSSERASCVIDELREVRADSFTRTHLIVVKLTFLDQTTKPLKQGTQYTSHYE